MMARRVNPVLLLQKAGVVKTVNFKAPRYVGDPINAVRILNEKEVDEIAVLDIEASVQERGPDFDRIAQIASECFMPMGYGGGITSLDQITQLFKIGIEKVILGTAAVQDPGLVKKASSIFGSQSIVVCIDYKRNFWGRPVICYKSARQNGKVHPLEFAKKMEDLGAGEIIVQAVDRDGTMAGYDLEMLAAVAGAVQIPVIACGGAGSLDHFRRAFLQGKASAAAAGSLFVFYGKHRAVLVNYPTREELDSILGDVNEQPNS